jgi:hypothetical protein
MPALSEHVKNIANARAAAAGYANVFQYIDALILADAGEPISPALEAHLLAALKSPPIEVTPEYWDDKRKNLSNGF